jgi:hypothetical protein
VALKGALSTKLKDGRRQEKLDTTDQWEVQLGLTSNSGCRQCKEGMKAGRWIESWRKEQAIAERAASKA